jgi:DegV family protein with EDD domain
MGKIAIITDSTSSIPASFRHQYNLTVLPQILIWGELTYRDGVDIQPDEFYARLQNSKENPSTSQVTPAAFKEAYENLTREGYEILAVLISSRLSGTIDAARQAIELVPDAKVTIFDSYTVAMALGFQVLAAARALENGKSMQEVLGILEKTRGETGVILTPKTLEYLYRGGRIGGASRFLGTALNIKPILTVIEGRVEPLERVRTRRKAMARVVELVEERAGNKPIRVAAQHAKDLEGAEDLLTMAKARLNVSEGFISEVSPVIGTHVGPGTVAISYHLEA